jgi:predicted branched-subunit amino acid permease
MEHPSLAEIMATLDLLRPSPDDSTMSDETSPAAPFTRSGFRRGCIAALPLMIGTAVGGFAMGVAYRGLDLGLAAAVLFSLIVYSGTAQAVTLGLWTTNPPIAAMMLATLITNGRYLAMGAHLRHLFPDVKRRVMMPILYITGDAAWMMTAAEAAQGRRDAAYLLGLNMPMAIGWIGGTALGYMIPVTPAGPLAVAAAFLPLGFIAALLPMQWRGKCSLMPWTVAAGVSLVVVGAIGQGWAMLIGGAAGTLVAALRGDDA